MPILPKINNSGVEALTPKETPGQAIAGATNKAARYKAVAAPILKETARVLEYDAQQESKRKSLEAGEELTAAQKDLDQRVENDPDYDLGQYERDLTDMREEIFVSKGDSSSARVNTLMKGNLDNMRVRTPNVVNESVKLHTANRFDRSHQLNKDKVYNQILDDPTFLEEGKLQLQAEIYNAPHLTEEQRHLETLDINTKTLDAKLDRYYHEGMFTEGLEILQQQHVDEFNEGYRDKRIREFMMAEKRAAGTGASMTLSHLTNNRLQFEAATQKNNHESSAELMEAQKDELDRLRPLVKGFTPANQEKFRVEDQHYQAWTYVDPMVQTMHESGGKDLDAVYHEARRALKNEGFNDVKEKQGLGILKEQYNYRQTTLKDNSISVYRDDPNFGAGYEDYVSAIGFLLETEDEQIDMRQIQAGVADTLNMIKANDDYYGVNPADSKLFDQDDRVIDGIRTSLDNLKPADQLKKIELLATAYGPENSMRLAKELRENGKSSSVYAGALATYSSSGDTAISESVLRGAQVQAEFSTNGFNNELNDYLKKTGGFMGFSPDAKAMMEDSIFSHYKNIASNKSRDDLKELNGTMMKEAVHDLVGKPVRLANGYEIFPYRNKFTKKFEDPQTVRNRIAAIDDATFTENEVALPIKADGSSVPWAEVKRSATYLPAGNGEYYVIVPHGGVDGVTGYLKNAQGSLYKLPIRDLDLDASEQRLKDLATPPIDLQGQN